MQRALAYTQSKSQQFVGVAAEAWIVYIDAKACLAKGKDASAQGGVAKDIARV